MADKKVVAIDIGGTAIKSGMWNGRTLEEIKDTCCTGRGSPDGACKGNYKQLWGGL